MGVCSISSKRLNRDALVTSNLSGRTAARVHGVRCSLSGDLALTDEVTRSDVSGEFVVTDLLRRSAISGQRAEPAHFASCVFTGAEVLKSELLISDLSSKCRYRADERHVWISPDGRDIVPSLSSARTPKGYSHRARPETCDVTGKSYSPGILQACAETKMLTHPSELELCDVARAAVQRRLLKASAVSGRRASAHHFGRCEFTSSEVLASELLSSEISGKVFRVDQALSSAPTGRTGHKSEFFHCIVTRQPIASDEAHRCSVTGQWVAPGVLETCAASVFQSCQAN